jgi:hypothetical protein
LTVLAELPSIVRLGRDPHLLTIPRRQQLCVSDAIDDFLGVRP